MRRVDDRNEGDRKSEKRQWGRSKGDGAAGLVTFLGGPEKGFKRRGFCNTSNTWGFPNLSDRIRRWLAGIAHTYHRATSVTRKGRAKRAPGSPRCRCCVCGRCVRCQPASDEFGRTTSENPFLLIPPFPTPLKALSIDLP